MSYHNQTRAEIETILRDAFKPNMLEVIDDSAAHRGHAEALLHQSAGHFKVIMKSSQFDGLTPVKRHRLVYEKLSGLMDSKIHALSLNLMASDE
jgi:BolA family transcriptional regulator, general stress-responsive regulator